jgi:amino acid adenylation domain-containing protein
LSLSGLLFERACVYSPLEAFSVRDRTVTYGELSARALAIAAALLELGADRETVAVVGQRKAASYFGIAGILFAGCSYTPINPKYSELRIARTLANAGVRFLVGSREDLEAVALLLGRKKGGEPTKFIVADGPAPVGSGWFGARDLERIAPLSEPVSSKLGDLAYLLYTSGSTGMPKGVQVTHSNIRAFLRSMAAIYDVEPGFRASQTFDLSFDPSVADMFFTWTKGGVLCVLPEEEVLLPSEYLRRERVSFLNLVPSIGEFMRRMGALEPGCFPDLRHTMFCGEQFPQQLADAWRVAAPNSTIENLYGPTEATIYVSRYLYPADQAQRQFRNSVVPIGRPFIGHEVALVDENGDRVPAETPGEIAFKGPQVTRGYLNDPDGTDAAFVTFDWDEDGGRWYRTADLGVMNRDGNVECLGRVDNQVKVAGRRIELGEIEAALRLYPELSDVVVVPVRNDHQVVTRLVAFTTGELSSERETFVRLDSRTALERVFFPKAIVTIDSFPLSASGKTDRKALEQMAAGSSARVGRLS